MVFFCCERCNETLKKSQLAGHGNKCYPLKVSCVDCNVVFDANTSKSHLTCISEAEKYEKSLYKGNGKNKNKKLTPQETWIQFLETLVEDLNTSSSQGSVPQTIKMYLPQIVSMGNVPRNMNKFKNMLQNSLKIRNQNDISSIWNYIDERFQAKKQNDLKEKEKQQEAVDALKSLKEAQSPNEDKTQNKKSMTEKKKDRKKDDDTMKEEESKLEPQEKDISNILPDFNWKKEIKNALKTSKDKRMKLKKLRKSIRVIFTKECKESKIKKETFKTLFERKLKDVKKLIIDEKYVLYQA